MNRYAVRIGSALALLLIVAAVLGVPAAAAPRRYIFEGKRIAFTRVMDQMGGEAIAIDDPGLQELFDLLGATVTYQSGQRYVLITTAEPVIVSFAIGDRRYDIGPVTQNASFAPFSLDGRTYVPLADLLRGLDLAPVRDGSRTILVPQLAELDVQSDPSGAKLVAHGGIPLDARIVSQSANRLVMEIAGVASMLPPTRKLSAGPVERIDVRSEGAATSPHTLVTLYLAPGTTHTPIGTDDQRDLTIGFDGALNAQPVAAALPEPSPQITAPGSPSASGSAAATGSPAALAQITAVQTQVQNGMVSIRIGVSGALAYDWERLRPPDNRWWIDLHGATLAIAPGDEPGIAPVTEVRFQQNDPTTVRVALSLADFDVVDVTTDSGGITITVSPQLADLGVEHSGSGSFGEGAQAAIAQASPTVPPGWEFGPSPTASAYVPANPRLIVIDPGHGGSDFGAVHGGMVEKTINLEISKRLRDILVARGWQVIMTRTRDRDVYKPYDTAYQELQARDDIANHNGARLFVSIHANSFINAGPHGATVYYYKPEDLPLAQAIDRRIASELSITNDGVVKDKLYVIHHADMPATLVETAFISNPDDRLLLGSPQWRQKMAQAIADGIGDYVGAPPPPPASANQ